MAGNSIGTIFRLTTFGESHGSAIGGVIDGVPSGAEINIEKIQQQLDRRRPGQSKITTQRKESDTVQILSGIFENKSTGMPIGFIIQNSDTKSSDYDHLKDTFRPSHADFTYQEKYGHRDHRGGGRSSARETACRVVAGAIAQQILASVGIEIWAYVSSVGEIDCDKPYQELQSTMVDQNIVRCPDQGAANRMIARIEEVRKAGDTVGGTITCVVHSIPAGLGEPVFDKLHADMSKAVMSINAVKGFELGSGFEGSRMLGSEHNDIIDQTKKTTTNHSGGIQGGISNGLDIYFRAAFKPVATLMRDQPSITDAGTQTVVKGKGRHDPCVVPRAVPILESMTAITILDHYLRNKATKVT